MRDKVAVWVMSAFLGSSPRFGRRWTKDRAKEHDRLVAKLHGLAMEGNVKAVVFALKVRHAHREGSSNVLVNIALPPP